MTRKYLHQLEYLSNLWNHYVINFSFVLQVKTKITYSFAETSIKIHLNFKKIPVELGMNGIIGLWECLTRDLYTVHNIPDGFILWITSDRHWTSLSYWDVSFPHTHSSMFIWALARAPDLHWNWNHHLTIAHNTLRKFHNEQNIPDELSARAL